MMTRPPHMNFSSGRCVRSGFSLPLSFGTGKLQAMSWSHVSCTPLPSKMMSLTLTVVMPCARIDSSIVLRCWDGIFSVAAVCWTVIFSGLKSKYIFPEPSNSASQAPPVLSPCFSLAAEVAAAETCVHLSPAALQEPLMLDDQGLDGDLALFRAERRPAPGDRVDFPQHPFLHFPAADVE